MKTRSEQMDERLEQMPKPYRATYRRAKKGRSQAAAIRSFCLECVGWQREEVRLCTDTGCPLYEYRLTGRKQPKASRGVQNGCEISA